MKRKLLPIKSEGAPCHPDSMSFGSLQIIGEEEYPDELYLKQLQLYKDYYGDSTYDTFCSRPHLLGRLK
jgi:hypothetical protein